MREIRLVGRGGQGVVTAGDLLGQAAIDEGRWAQSIPTFGPERRGAMAVSTLRLSDEEILLKFSSAQPDVVLVIDPTVWRLANVLLGVRPGATLIFNAAGSPEAVRDALVAQQGGDASVIDTCEIFTVDATGLALEVLGKAIPNTAMMGALVTITGVVELASVERVLEQRFGPKAAANVQVARLASERLHRLEN